MCFPYQIGNQLELQSEIPSRMYQVCFNKSLGTTAGFCAFEVLFGDENGNWGRRTVSASGNVWASAALEQLGCSRGCDYFPNKWCIN
jgi:hypothetical protein